MISSVMSWDLQKTRCNYQSSEEALVQKSSFKCPGARFTKTDKTRPVKNQTPSSNLNSPRTHLYSFLLPLSLPPFPPSPLLLPKEMSWLLLMASSRAFLVLQHCDLLRKIPVKWHYLALLCRTCSWELQHHPQAQTD